MGTLQHLIHLLKEQYNNNITLIKVDGSHPYCLTYMENIGIITKALDD